MNRSASSSPSSSFKMDRTKVLKNFWYCASLSKDVKKNQLKSTKVLGKNIALFRDPIDNNVYCLEDSCPHRNAPLSKGWIESIESSKNCGESAKTHIVCPYHGWSFDRSGKIQHIPSMPRSTPSSKQVLRTYDIEEKDGFVWLFYGSKNVLEIDRPPIPHIDEFDELDKYDRKRWACAYGEIEIEAPHFNVFDNALDISHIHYLHSFGNRESQESQEVRNICMDDSKGNEDALYSLSGTLDIQNRPINVFWEWTKIDVVPVRFTAFLPSTSAIKITLGRGVEMITFVHTVPIDQKRSVNRFCLLRNFARFPLLDYFAERVMLKVLQEDKVMLESLVNPSTNENENQNQNENEISVMTDMPQIGYRKLWQSWAQLGYLVDL